MGERENHDTLVHACRELARLADYDEVGLASWHLAMEEAYQFVRRNIQAEERRRLDECRCWPDPNDGVMVVNDCVIHNPASQKAEPHPAFQTAVESIYFGDRSDYLPALWQIAKSFDPTIKDEQQIKEWMDRWYPDDVAGQQ